MFTGVLAVGYQQFDDMRNFLVSTFHNSNMVVAIYEKKKEPRFLIGLSTGTAVEEMVLISDTSQPCPPHLMIDKAACRWKHRGEEDEILVDAFNKIQRRRTATGKHQGKTGRKIGDVPGTSSDVRAAGCQLGMAHSDSIAYRLPRQTARIRSFTEIISFG